MMDRNVSSAAFSPINAFVYVNKDTLEEALTVDVTLADFFSEFLQLPVFPRPMVYNTNSHSVEERDAEQADTNNRVCQNRSKMMKWVKEARAELFFRSFLFSEYKLCKLLTVPVHHHCDSKGCCSGTSTAFDGRSLPEVNSSVQKPEVNYTLSVSGNNWNVRDSSVFERRVQSACTRRKFSKENAVVRTCYSTKQHSRVALSESAMLSTQSERSLQPRHEMKKSITFSTLAERLEFSDTVTIESRSNSFQSGDVSAQTLHSDDTECICGEQVNFADHYMGDFSVGSDFDDDDDDDNEDDDNDDAQTEADVRNLESRTGKSVFQIMTDTLSSVAGLTKFKAFLTGKVGFSALNAWLDIDNYTSNAAASGREQTRLLRLLAQKYSGSVVGSRAIGWLQRCHHCDEGNPLLQIQSTILRRLRSYWCPRFIVHNSQTRSDLFWSKSAGFSALPRGSSRSAVKSSQAFSRPLPLLSDGTEVSCLAVENSNKLLPLTYRIQSAHVASEHPRQKCELVAAFQCDAEAGRPFMKFLQKSGKEIMLNNLLFLQSLTQLSEPSVVRHGALFSQLEFAWSLWNTYLDNDSIWPIGVNQEIKKTIFVALNNSTVSVSLQAFQSVECYAIDVLRSVWLEYLKSDEDQYLSLCQDSPELSPVLRCDSSVQLSTVVDTVPDDSQKMLPVLKQKKKKQTKTVAAFVSKDSIQAPDSVAIEASTKDGLEPLEKSSEPRPSKVQQDAKPLMFANVAHNEMVLKAFKDYLSYAGYPVALNRLLLWLDIQSVLSINSNPSNRSVLTMQAHQNFLSENAKRPVLLPESLMVDFNIKSHLSRPSTGMLTAIQEHLVSSIQLRFEEFLQTLDSSQSGHTVESVLALQILLQKRRKYRKGPGKAMSTPELLADLKTVLSSIEGPWPPKLDSFRTHLRFFGLSENCPLAENDLSFYVEAQKLKDMCLGFVDKAVIKRKAMVVADCFLDCSSPPWLQVDIQPDLAHRLLNYIRGNPHPGTKSSSRLLNEHLLDEAQGQVLKELAPFWAGFVKRYKAPDVSDEHKHSLKHRKKEKCRLVVAKANIQRKRALNSESVGKGSDSTLSSIVHCSLPPLPSAGLHACVSRQLAFSLTSGVYWKAMADEEVSTSAL